MKNVNQHASDDSNIDTVSKLKAGCKHSLVQCEELLSQLSEQEYCASTDQSSSIGGHVRHILDRFLSFFQGLPAAHIDYDVRAHDKSIETKLSTAKFELVSILRRLDALSVKEAQEQVLSVSEIVHHQGFTVQVSSTAQRELMGLVTHSVHHLAIIALLAKGLGHSVDQRFGKAPSTVVFESS